MSYYYCGRCLKWWKHVFFFYLLEPCMLIAYLIKTFGMSKEQLRGKTFLEFWIELADQLIGSFCGKAVLGHPRRSYTPDELRLDISKCHSPKQVAIKGRCAVCAYKGRQENSRREYRHESRIVCRVFNVHLCVAVDRDCFHNYHFKPRSQW